MTHDTPHPFNTGGFNQIKAVLEAQKGELSPGGSPPEILECDR
jgi:hypothetical protein